MPTIHDAGNFRRPMNPFFGSNVLVHPLARMLPLFHLQSQVYRLGERLPPGLEGYTPIWEVAPFLLAGRATQQARISFKRDFHLLALMGSSSAAGGFRLQLYDMAKKRKLTDRGVAFANLLGTGGDPMFLREPHRFDAKDSQALLIVQNQDAAANTIEVVLYGVALRWNE